MADHTNETPEEVPLLAEVGSSGLRRFGGFVRDEWHRKLHGTRAARIYEEINDNHPVVSAGFNYIEMLSRQVKYRVESTGDTVEHEKARMLIETALEDIEGGIKKVLTDALTFMPYGWSVLEKVFKISRGRNESKLFNSKFDDGLIRWRKFGIRSQRSLFRWQFDENGNWTAMEQRAPPDHRLRVLPRSKVLHFKLRDNKDSPEGRSMLRGLYTSWYMEKHHKFIEAIGIERNIAGFPLITVPVEIMHPKAKDELKSIRAQYEKVARSIKVDELTGLVFPAETDRNGNATGYSFKLVSSGGRQFAATDPVIRRYRQEIAMVLMAEFLVVGMDKIGALSLADSKTDMFAMGVAAVMDMVLDTLNEDAVPELVRLNGLPEEVAPKIKRSDIETPDLAAVAAFISGTASVGAITVDDSLEDHLRDIANFPMSDREESARPIRDILAEQRATQVAVRGNGSTPPEPMPTEDAG